MFVAGVETTSTSLLWSVLFLTQNQEKQRKLQAEVDEVLEGRVAQRDDKPKLAHVQIFVIFCI